MERWPHQIETPKRFWELYGAGERRICITAPPRAGKTVMMLDIIMQAKSMGMRVCVFTHRIMLTEQMSRVFYDMGMDHGVRAAGFDSALLRDVQICSVQTEYMRSVKNELRELHDAQLVIWDEAHLHRGKSSLEIINRYLAKGACVLGFTATPVAIGHIYTQLIASCYNSDLRACGAHVPCHTYGPDEPNLASIRKTCIGEYKQQDISKKIMVPGIFGRVIKHWRILNPEQKATILFAPGVKESKWFVEQFRKEGIAAAHIDGESVVVDGQEYGSDRAARDDVLARSKAGDIKVVSNRFVLREALDMPWLAHGIGATVFGAEHTFVQAGSRILNAYPGMDHVIWQDHGGSWHSHGSLNEDRKWKLEDTYTSREKAKKEDLESGRLEEPICCPKCGGIRRKGPKCPYCGHVHQKSVRMVVQHDGALKRMTGQAVKRKKPPTKKMQELKAWQHAYYSSLNGKSNKTMNQVRAYYRHLTNGAALPEVSTVPPHYVEHVWKMSVGAFEKYRRTEQYQEDLINGWLKNRPK